MKVSDKIKHKALTYFHHAIVVFGVFGWTYSYHLHFLFMIIVITSWIINDNKCIVSQLQDKYGSQHSSAYFQKIGLELDETDLNFANYIIWTFGAMASLAKI